MTNEELQKIYVKADMQYDALKDNIHYLAEENKQLKEELETLKDAFDFNLGAIENIRKGKNKLEETIDKAIEWVHEHISKYNCKGITIIDWDNLSNPNDLLEILGDKK